MSDKELEKTKSREVMDARKALMNDQDFTGFEGQTQDMLSTPFLKIAQTNSLQLDDRDDKTEPLEAGKISGLRPGMFYNSQTGKVFGKKIEVIALFAKESYLYYGKGLGNFKGEYKKLEQVEELVQRGILVKDEGGMGWHDKDDPDPKKAGKCFYAITFLCFLPEFPEEGILPFVVKSKGLKYAKNWNSLSSGMMIKINKVPTKAARYQLVWTLEIKKDANDQGTWYNLGDSTGSGISFAGNIFEDKYTEILEPLATAKEIVKTMKERQINYAAEADRVSDSKADHDDFLDDVE